MPNLTLVHEWLPYTAGKKPDKTAVICGQQKITYQQLDRKSDLLADALLSLGLALQDRVVIFLDNSIETVLSLYGILKAGGIFVVVNMSMKSEKLAYILDNTDAAVLISHTSKAGVVLEALRKSKAAPKTIWVHPDPVLPESVFTAAEGLHWDTLFLDPPSEKNRPILKEGDLASLIYTSGSTGQPKAVMQPHGKMTAVSQSIIEYLDNSSEDIVLNVLSLSFGYGLYQILMSVMYGGTIVLENSFVFLHDILRKIAAHKVTGFPIVPPVAAMLLKMNDLASCDFSSLRYITCAGAALPPEHTSRLRSLWPHVQLIPMHGLTECVRTCYLPPDQIDIRPDSVGVPISGCQLHIMDENGQEVPAGQVGEMVVTGMNVMPGYWRDPELTEAVFRPGKKPGQRHLYTGDLFKRDEEGYLYFVSRKGDMIKTRGERVYPKEVENILLRLEGVAEAAVVGVPDPIFGQVPKAFLVKTPESTLTEKAVMQFASQNMENFMIPKYVQFLSDFPRTSSGKIDKKQLS